MAKTPVNAETIKTESLKSLFAAAGAAELAVGGGLRAVADGVQHVAGLAFRCGVAGEAIGIVVVVAG